jgi:hypothetical protein
MPFPCGPCDEQSRRIEDAKDARISANPQKRRHVVTALQGLDLRVSTLFGVDTGGPKALSGEKFRVSILFAGSGVFVVEVTVHDHLGRS